MHASQIQDCELAMVEIGEVYMEKSSGPRTEPNIQVSLRILNTDGL